MTYTYYDFNEKLPEINESLVLIDNLRTQIDREKSSKKAVWIAIQEKLRVDWTFDSNAIEGSTLTRGEALFFLKDTPAIDENGQKIRKPANPGKYKILPNHVLKTDGTLHFYTDPIHVSDEMEILCRWIDENIEKRHPLIVASIAHYNMVRIHPFDDGNGRGARILMNLILIKVFSTPTLKKKELFLFQAFLVCFSC